MNKYTAPWEPTARKLLADPETRAAYDALEDRYQLVVRFIRMRLAAGLTQAQVAERMGVTQGRVAQLESLNTPALPSLASIRRFAAACGQRLALEFEPLTAPKRAKATRVAEAAGSYSAKARRATTKGRA